MFFNKLIIRGSIFFMNQKVPLIPIKSIMKGPPVSVYHIEHAERTFLIENIK